MKRAAAAAALAFVLAGCSSRVTVFVRNVRWDPVDQTMTVERCELEQDAWTHASDVDPKSCTLTEYRRAPSAQKASPTP